MKVSKCSLVHHLALGFLMISGFALSCETAHAEEKVDIAGQISRLSIPNKSALKNGILRIVLVEGPKAPNTSYDKAMVKITKTTKLFKMVDQSKKPATIEDVTSGVRVEVIFTGPVAESYPVQATAEQIVIFAKK